MNFDSYIFDFDGTLIDTTTCHVKAIQSAFKRLNLDEPTEQAILHTYHLNLYNNFKALASHELSFYQIEKLIDEYHRCFSNDEIHQSKEYTGISEALQFLHNQKKKYLYYLIKIH